MSKWPLVPLDEVFEIARGGSPRPIDAYFTEDLGGINWVLIGDASESSKYINKTRKRIRKEGVSKSRMVHPGDFLLSNSMSFGKPYIMGTSGCVHDGWLVLTPRQENIDSDFLYHLLGSDTVYREFVRRAAGATVKNLNIELVKGVHIPLPPIEEQRRIAAILDQAEALRTKRRHFASKTEVLTRSVFADLFGQTSRSSSLWPMKPLSTLCARPDDIRCGPFGTQLSQSEFCEDGVPLWGIRNVNRKFELPTVEYLTDRKATALKNYDLVGGDIVMTRKGTIGNCAVYPDTFPVGIMHSDLLRIRLDPDVCDPIFLAEQLQISKYVEHQISLFSGGAVMPGINVSRLKSVEVFVPPLPAQRQFSAIFRAIRRSSLVYKESTIKLEELFASLQYRAFNGEL